MREELEIKLTNALVGYVSQEQLSEIRFKFAVLLSDYEIGMRETELAVMDESRNEMAIKRFVATKLAAGRSRKTLLYYKQSLDAFFFRVQKDFDRVTADDIRVYLATRVNVDKVTKVTANNERRCVSSFYTWAQNEELIVKNPMAKVEPMKITKEKKKAFTDMDIEKLRSGCKTNRERAMFELLLSTWCRVSELAQIKVSEVDGNEILVHGKGDKDRIVYLNARAQLVLEDYLKERKDTNPYLFPKSVASFASDQGGTMRTNKWYLDRRNVDPNLHADASTIEHIMRKLGEHSGVENTHPHRFRRTGATMALRAGMPLMTVSKLLGHSNIGVTQIYLDISDDELEEAHRKFVR